MSCCHFLLIIIAIAIMLIYKEFFKNAKIDKMLLKIGYVKLLIFCLRVFIEGEILTVN